jgi:predicted dehydrogenase
LKVHIPTIRTLSTGVTKFIGPHWAKGGRSVLLPRFTFDDCVPGRPENIEENAKIAAGHGFGNSYRDLDEALSSGEQFQMGMIATPNHRHLPEAEAMMRAGIDVAIEKPLEKDAARARQIALLAKELGRKTLVTATYCGCPGNLEARHRIYGEGRGSLVRGGRATYLQGWRWKKVADMKPEEGRDQADWRADAEKSGEGGALGDILSHLLFEIWFVTGQPIVAVKRANRRYVVEGPEREREGGKKIKTTDDDTTVIVVLENGAEITCQAVQYAGGHQNDNAWELWLEDGSAYRWDISQDTETLWVGDERLSSGSFNTPMLAATCAIPARHGDGWHDAGARLLQWLGWEITNTRPDGVEPLPLDALIGLNISLVIDAIIESANEDGKIVETGWVKTWDDLATE